MKTSSSFNFSDIYPELIMTIPKVKDYRLTSAEKRSKTHIVHLSKSQKTLTKHYLVIKERKREDVYSRKEKYRTFEVSDERCRRFMFRYILIISIRLYLKIGFYAFREKSGLTILVRLTTSSLHWSLRTL